MKPIKRWVTLAGFLSVAGVQADPQSITLAVSFNKAPPSACQRKESAEAEARESVFRAAQTYCRSEGFGWRSSSVRDLGKLECLPCDANRFNCVYSGVSLECRKPERVSLLGWLGGKP